MVHSNLIIKDIEDDTKLIITPRDDKQELAVAVRNNLDDSVNLIFLGEDGILKLNKYLTEFIKENLND